MQPINQPASQSVSQPVNQQSLHPASQQKRPTEEFDKQQEQSAPKKKPGPFPGSSKGKPQPVSEERGRQQGRATSVPMPCPIPTPTTSSRRLSWWDRYAEILSVMSSSCWREGGRGDAASPCCNGGGGGDAGDGGQHPPQKAEGAACPCSSSRPSSCGASPSPSSVSATNHGGTSSSSHGNPENGGGDQSKTTTTTTALQAVVAATTTTSSKPAVKRVVSTSRVKRIPEDILQDKQLASAMKQLPSNYNFEIHKTIWRLREAGARRVALQFPEGLLMYACTIADIMERFGGSVEEVVIMGDVTYGACCVDDLTAQAIGADFLVHYGHSCLVPVDLTTSPSSSGGLKGALYVFVEIGIDTQHLVKALIDNIPGSRRVCLMGTIQFVSALHEAASQLRAHFRVCEVPQAKPLSPGEVLGCTAPANLLKKTSQGAAQEGNEGSDDDDVLVFVADGRFHLEAVMIANPGLECLRYNPYDKSLTREHYDTHKMHKIRRAAVSAAAGAGRWGVILGTLGRQGNPAILTRVTTLLQQRHQQSSSYFIMLLSEITPAKVACPRLSIDWGHFFDKPVLTPYELEVAVGAQEPWQSVYPMDYYAKGSGTWTNLHPDNAKRGNRTTAPQKRPPPLAAPATTTTTTTTTTAAAAAAAAVKLSDSRDTTNTQQQPLRPPSPGPEPPPTTTTSSSTAATTDTSSPSL